MTILAVAVGLVFVAWAVFAFNRLVRLRNQMRAAWADIDVQLTRRHDLVPRLVAAVKGYAGHERTVLEAVTELRARAVALTSPSRLGEVESSLEHALAKVVALKEAYPALKASESFLELQRGLVEVEDHLQYARRFYNGAVRDYHNAIERLPDVMLARAFGFGAAEFFQASDDDPAAAARRAPRVEMS